MALAAFLTYFGVCKLIDHLSESQDEETIFTSQSQFGAYSAVVVIIFCAKKNNNQIIEYTSLFNKNSIQHLQ